MCGLVGICSKDKNLISNFPINKLMRTLKHRGPDQSNFKKLDNVIFGHTRLSIIGVNSLSAKQPISNTNYILIFNGEIYNYHVLKQELDERNICASGESDTEILYLYLTHFGIKKTLKRIDGMFVFAFYDNKKKKIYIARDRIGEKFIYWSKKKNSFFFASEIKTLIASELLNVKPNLKKINEIFFHGKIYGKETMFENIFELEAGTYLEYSPVTLKVKIKTYWNLEDFSKISLQKNFLDDFDEKFRNAVKTRMVSDVPIASLISGGLDSSSLVTKMLEIENNRNLNLFFYDTSSKEINEKKDVDLFVKNILKKYQKSKINLYISKKNIKSFLRNFYKMTFYNDEPLTYTNFYLVYELSKKAKQKKNKVIFSGEGSDEILFGYDRFFNTHKLLSKCKNNYEKIKNIYFGSGIINKDIIKKITHNFFSDFHDYDSWNYLIKIYKNFDYDTVQMLFSQKFRIIGLLQRQDRAAMANSVESRAPFLSPNFLTWVNGLPNSFKRDLKERKSKIILRKNMQNKLPKRIIEKEKIGFPTDFDMWLKSPSFINFLRKKIIKNNSFSSNYLDRNFILQLLNLKSDELNNYYFILSRIFCLEIWHEVFFNPKQITKFY